MTHCSAFDSLERQADLRSASFLSRSSEKFVSKLNMILRPLPWKSKIIVAKRAGAKQSSLRVIRDLFRIAWVMTMVIGILSLSGLASEFSALTVSGIASISVTLALQSTLSNVISGFLLFNDKAIRLDDEIQFSGIKGKIVHIALRSTWIRTADGNLMMVSNSNLSAGPLINYTAAKRLELLAS